MLITSLTKLMNAILEHYPKTELVTIDIFDSNEGEYGWTSDYCRITLRIKGQNRVLTPDEIYTHLGGSHYISFGKNNQSRKIVRNKFMTVYVEAKQKEFTTNQGETVKYYPSRTSLITDNKLIKELRNLSLTRLERFNELNYKGNDDSDSQLDVEE